jgi:molybdate transport system regulatory protein
MNGSTSSKKRPFLLRLYLSAELPFGPGKADVLEAIAASGSISAAGRALGMSYRRTWQLVTAMNTHFREPLVNTAAGGSSGGGAQLSKLGQDVLARYRKMQVDCAAAIADDLRCLQSQLGERSG